MKKKILVVSSDGNLGGYLFNKLKKNNIVSGIQKKNSHDNNFQCKDLSNSKMNFETFRVIKKKNLKFDAIIICSGKSEFDIALDIEQKFISSFKSNFLSVANTIFSYQKIYKNKPTKIIIISSIAAMKIIDAPIEYSISKAALNHYCKIKAKELSEFNIKLNVISPGNIFNKNNNWYFKMKSNNKIVKKYIKKYVPLNTFCDPDYILALCNLLISPQGSFFQGSNIIIDGGQSL